MHNIVQQRKWSYVKFLREYVQKRLVWTPFLYDGPTFVPQIWEYGTNSNRRLHCRFRPFCDEKIKNE